MENYQILSRIIYQLMVIVIINEYRWLSWSSLGILRHQMKKNVWNLRHSDQQGELRPKRSLHHVAASQAPGSSDRGSDRGADGSRDQSWLMAKEDKLPWNTTAIAAHSCWCNFDFGIRDPKSQLTKLGSILSKVPIKWKFFFCGGIFQYIPTLVAHVCPKTRSCMPPFQEPMPKVQPEEVWVRR